MDEKWKKHLRNATVAVGIASGVGVLGKYGSDSRERALIANGPFMQSVELVDESGEVIPRQKINTDVVKEVLLRDINRVRDDITALSTNETDSSMRNLNAVMEAVRVGNYSTAWSDIKDALEALPIAAGTDGIRKQLSKAEKVIGYTNAVGGRIDRPGPSIIM